MANKWAWEQVISDPNAPKRLQGRKICSCVNETTKQLEFTCDVPDDITRQEQGYLRLKIGELVEHLREKIPNKIGPMSRSEILSIKE